MQQLDIFADSLPVQRANDLIVALANMDSIASRNAMRRLVAADSHHAGLPQFQILCDFVERWADSWNKPDWLCTQAAIATEEQLIREQIVPATLVMGNAGAELVCKCWGILAKASELAGIAPEHSNCFAAELYLRATLFYDAVRTARNLPGADLRATVQRWLGLGFYGCGETEQARKAVLRFAWLAPQHFDALVEETGNTQLALDWNDFQVDLGDLDATWFPAWCAHEKKASLSMLDNLPESDGGTAYRLVMGLAIRERGGLCRAVYEDRAHLKRLDASFFEFYMLRRSDQHALKK